MKVVVSDHALQDIEAIGDWIAAESPVNALQFVSALKSQCLNLAEFPDRHPIFKASDQALIRRKVFRNYVIFYAVVGDCVSIIRVIHGAQDYGELFTP